MLERANPLDMPTIIWRAFSRGARSRRRRQVDAYSGLPARLSSLGSDGRAIPLQVDGDYIGEVTEATYGIAPRAPSSPSAANTTQSSWPR